MRIVKLENLPIEWKRGGGLRKSDVISDGKNHCILYGELFTRHKNVLIDIDKLSKTNNTGTVLSKKGDILIPGTSTASKRDMILAREIDISDVSIGGDINIIRPKEYIFAPKYLPYFFSTPDAYAQLEKYITGATGIIHISNVGIKNLDIPLPSIEMQKRIVIKLDEAFEKIDRAIELTNQNILNVNNLLQAKFNEFFKESHRDKKQSFLSDVTTYISRGVSPKYIESDGVVVLNQRCIRDHEILNTEARRHDLSQKNVSCDKFIKTNDILINSTGQGTLGRTAMATSDHEGCLCDSHVTIVRPADGLFIPGYFGYLIETFEPDFIRMATGTSGQTELPRALLCQIQVSYFEDKEYQVKVYTELSRLRKNIKLIVDKYDVRIKNLSGLKQSMLNEAFSESDVK